MGANFPEFNGVVLSVVGDVPVDSEAPVVTSSIYQGGFAGPHQSTTRLLWWLLQSIKEDLPALTNRQRGSCVDFFNLSRRICRPSPIYQGGFAGPIFEDAHRGRVCVRVFIGVILKKKEKKILWRCFQWMGIQIKMHAYCFSTTFA